MSRPLYLLDTNIVEYLLSGRSQAVRRRYSDLEDSETCALSTITEAEVRFGCERLSQATRLRAEVEHLLSSMRILSWDSGAAQAYARLRVHAQSLGRSLEATDLFIAAHALSLGATLVTRDQDFAGLAPLIRIENWATDI